MDKVSPLAPSGACQLRRETFCISKGGPESLLLPAPEHVCGITENFQPDERQHEPYKSPPSTPGNGNMDWCNLQHNQEFHTTNRAYLLELSKHNSFEQDESLGILSPDQMKTDLTMYGEVTLTPFRHYQQADDFQWSSFTDLTCEASLLDNQECPIYLHDTLEESRDSLLAVFQPLEDGKKPPSSLPLKVGECMKTPSDVFTPASIQADISDRTLSPEDLPLDEVCDPHVDLKLLEAVEASEFTGSASAEPSSRSSAPPVSSFVTSVTSITSLDNGYQGDGECSRPGSRGPDHYSPTAGHRPSLASALRVKGGTTQDPMTDSDFFTESDADVHEEVSAITGGGRGDRKAQVIDGTLYGSESHSSGSQSNGGATVMFSHGPQQQQQQQQHQRCPSFTASINEEMESSGVYSDLERKSDEQTDCPLKIVPPDSEVLTATQPDCSPDVSTKTSSRSDHSQVKDAFPSSVFSETATLDTTVVVCSVMTENVKIGQVAATIPNSVTKSPESIAGTGVKEATMVDQNNQEVFPKTGPVVENKLVKPDGPYLLKKYKMPKRNVVSKVKTLIDSSLSGTKSTVGSDNLEDRENKRPARTKSPKKGGRWDAVMNKIAQGQAENKWTPTKLKDVKSKVLMNIMPPPPPPVSHHGVSGVMRKGSLLLPNSRLNQDSPLKSKSRRNRTRASSSSLSQAQAGILNSSMNSSAHSSVSDLSVDHAQRSLCKASNKSNTTLGASKKREVGRSTSPLSDGSTNSATSHVAPRPAANHHPPPGLPRQSPRSAEERARDSGATNLQKRQPRNVRSLAATGSKRMQMLMGRRPTQTEEKNGVSAAAPADMKTPVRKVASRRPAPAAVQKPPTPLRDHNSRQQQAASGATKAPEVGHAPRKVPALPPQPSPEERLLPQLRHNSSGFEALSVLVQYLVFDLEAFTTPQLQRNLEQLNEEWIHTRLELEEVQASYRRLGEEMCQKVAAHRQELEATAASCHQQLAELQASHSHKLEEVGEMHAAELAELENKHQVVSQHVVAAEDQRRELLTQLDQVHQQSEALAQEAVLRDAENHKAMQEAAAREAELHQRLAAVDKENREEWRRVMDDLRKDKDSKLQVTAGRCKELQDEVQSLQTVLELRSQEIQDLRRQNAELTWAAEEVQSARQRIQSLQARVEDLQAQLRDKTTFERQLSQENKQLLESFHEENKQKKRLSQHNEELQYKLKQNKEYVLAALSTSLRSSTPASVDSYKTPCTPSQHAAILQHMSEPPTFLQLPLHGGDESPPQSPKVKSMVQKGDSVSWTLAMEEAPEICSRLIRRAGSFRSTSSGVSSGCASSPIRSRTLPPPKRQRCKATSLCLSSSAAAISPRQGQGSGGSFSVPGHTRSRSVSADSADDTFDMESYEWPSGGMQRNLLEEFGNGDNVTLSSLEHNREKVEDCGKLSGLGDGSSMKRSSPSESSNEADSPSKSSTSSSGSSNGLIQNGKGAEHLRGHRRKKGGSSQMNLVSSTSESMDNADPEVLPLPPLPGSSSSSDLSLLAACSVVQNSKIPKESGGEAMISEETSEDENQRDVINSSSDEQSSSDDDSSSSSLEMVNTGNALFIKSENGTVMCGQNNVGVSKFHKSQYQRLLQSGSGSMSAASTAMDASWSEDLELMPSESEG